MATFAAHLTHTDTLLRVNVVMNIIEAVVVLVVVGVLCKWAKRVVEFMELMNEMKNEEKMMRSRSEEWNVEDEVR